MTYSMLRAKAKADEEALAEAKKYKGLYDTGVSRIGRLQQEVSCLKIDAERNEKQKKALHSKLALLQDQLGSIRARSVR
jgi:predicted nuclease with TOPRIM domain